MNTETTTASGRIYFLDELRGITLISMILYHFMWDLVYIAGFDIPWYHTSIAHIWQQSICQTFILLSGFSWSLGHHPIRRGLIVSGGGALVTLVTVLFLPEDAVFFGVLTLIGSSMILTVLIDRFLSEPLKLSRRPVLAWIFLGLGIFMFLLFLPAQTGHMTDFAALLSGEASWRNGPALPMGLYNQTLTLPEGFYRGYLLSYLGFPGKGFASTDYFPLIPWFFLYIAGFFLYKLWTGLNRPGISWMRPRHIAPLAFIGRHCLLIYMLHQPVLYALTLVIYRFRRL